MSTPFSPPLTFKFISNLPGRVRKARMRRCLNTWHALEMQGYNMANLIRLIWKLHQCLGTNEGNAEVAELINAADKVLNPELSRTITKEQVSELRKLLT